MSQSWFACTRWCCCVRDTWSGASFFANWREKICRCAANDSTGVKLWLVVVQGVARLCDCPKAASRLHCLRRSRIFSYDGLGGHNRGLAFSWIGYDICRQPSGRRTSCVEVCLRIAASAILADCAIIGFVRIASISIDVHAVLIGDDTACRNLSHIHTAWSKGRLPSVRCQPHIVP